MQNLNAINKNTHFIKKDEFEIKLNAQIKRGTQLVFGGFVIAIIGIVGYCIVCFALPEMPSNGSLLHADFNLVVMMTLAVIALGTLLWLIGSFMYLNASMKIYIKDDE